MKKLIKESINESIDVIQIERDIRNIIGGNVSIYVDPKYDEEEINPKSLNIAAHAIIEYLKKNNLINFEDIGTEYHGNDEYDKWAEWGKK